MRGAGGPPGDPMRFSTSGSSGVGRPIPRSPRWAKGVRSLKCDAASFCGQPGGTMHPHRARSGPVETQADILTDTHTDLLAGYTHRHDTLHGTCANTATVAFTPIISTTCSPTNAHQPTDARTGINTPYHRLQHITLMPQWIDVCDTGPGTITS